MSKLIDRGDVLGVISCFFEDSFIEDADVHCAELEREINRLPAAPRWHRVEDDPPDEKTDVIFYYKWTGINGIRGREIHIISLGALIALGCRPIAWMEKPKPPKEDKL